MLNIICCCTIKKEVEYILKEIGLKDEVVFLNGHLHDYGSLKRDLTEQLKKKKEKDNNPTIVIIGQACHPDMNSILDQHSAVCLNTANCFEALLGSEKERLDKESNTGYLTSGYVEWVKHIGWTEVDARIYMGFFDRVILLDTGLVEISDEKILDLFDFIQVPIEIIKVNLEHLKKVIMEAIDRAKNNTPPG